MYVFLFRRSRSACSVPVYADMQAICQKGFFPKNSSGIRHGSEAPYISVCFRCVFRLHAQNKFRQNPPGHLKSALLHGSYSNNRFPDQPGHRLGNEEFWKAPHYPMLPVFYTESLVLPGCWLSYRERYPLKRICRRFPLQPQIHPCNLKMVRYFHFHFFSSHLSCHKAPDRPASSPDGYGYNNCQLRVHRSSHALIGQKP